MALFMNGTGLADPTIYHSPFSILPVGLAAWGPIRPWRADREPRVLKDVIHVAMHPMITTVLLLQ